MATTRHPEACSTSRPPGLEQSVQLVLAARAVPTARGLPTAEHDQGRFDSGTVQAAKVKTDQAKQDRPKKKGVDGSHGVLMAWSSWHGQPKSQAHTENRPEVGHDKPDPAMEACGGHPAQEAANVAAKGESSAVAHHKAGQGACSPMVGSDWILSLAR